MYFEKIRMYDQKSWEILVSGMNMNKIWYAISLHMDWSYQHKTSWLI